MNEILGVWIRQQIIRQPRNDSSHRYDHNNKSYKTKSLIGNYTIKIVLKHVLKLDFMSRL